MLVWEKPQDVAQYDEIHSAEHHLDPFAGEGLGMYHMYPFHISVCCKQFVTYRLQALTLRRLRGSLHPFTRLKSTVPSTCLVVCRERMCHCACMCALAVVLSPLFIII